MTENPFRLGREVLPERYDLVLQPDLSAASFTGSVTIECSVVDPVGEIVLNAVELDIHAVRVDGLPAEFRLDATTERLVIERALSTGRAVLHLEFTGTLNDKLRGFYRSTFRDESGNERVIATSQMQATDCRRAFPCFDEPDFKAVFAITLVVDADLLAVSNGPEVARDVRDDGRHAVRFADTMAMSTYLVALVVGPLEATEPVMVPRLGGGAIPLRVVHVPGKAHLTGFGLDAGAFALGWFQQYYGIAYPTEKCDMIALPDFAAGAMENLGCITYRESLLLADTSSATQAELQTLADVITHELAHMWFGDLVTMSWWNGIWLNEAFATFMEVACCDAYRPDWKRWATFGLERSVAFETDALAATRSVEYPVEAPADCDGMFDVLTYQKGGALLRMLQQYLGEEEFRRGVQHYLTTHSYGNTETSDLWDAIEAVNPRTPVRRMMDSWIWQPGFPLVGARLDGDALVLTQERFAFDVESLGEAAATVFVVPLHVRIGDDEAKVLLDADELRVPLADPSAAIVVNAGGHGFVRVAYDDVLRGRLTGDAIRSLDVVERYNLVDDAWSALVAGRLGAPELLSFLDGFRDEREMAVWQAIAVALRGLGRMIEGAARAAFQARVRALVSPALGELGWTPSPDESDLRSKLRGLLVSLAAVLGQDPDTQARCREIWNDSEGRHPELVAAATGVVAATGDERDFEQFLGAFRAAVTPQDQLRNLYALADFPSAELVQRACELAMSGEVRSQNAPFLLNRCIANRDHGEQAWAFVRRHWDEATERFPDNTIIYMIDSVKLLTGEAVSADVQGFFAEHAIPQSAKTLDQVLERQRVNTAVRAREADRLASSLTD
ncbi:MAG: M1 family metallopeptidase [Acidimicrobiales bacterium]|nr:M1 family metallopeptidase [Acidimicrobiales bacterium]